MSGNRMKVTSNTLNSLTFSKKHFFQPSKGFQLFILEFLEDKLRDLNQKITYEEAKTESLPVWNVRFEVESKNQF